MNPERRDEVAFVGNLLVDRIKMLDYYPKPGMLANISVETKAVGGCVPNTAIDLKTICPDIKISAYGKIGCDEDGSFLKERLTEKGIDISGIIESNEYMTAYTDVMTVTNSGERTFFHNRGASAHFSPDEVILESMNAKMLHAGYLLLLDGFDRKNEKYGTEMAAFLARAQALGIITSIDVVSDSSERFSEVVLPALKYTNNAIMNEIEGCGAVKIPPRDENGKLCPDNIRKAMEKLFEYGIHDRVIIHCPEAGFCLDSAGNFTVCSSLKLPKGYIKGTVGAGDAFCAGALYGIFMGLSDYEILEIASAAACSNLSAADSVSGMKNISQLKDILKTYEKQTI